MIGAPTAAAPPQQSAAPAAPAGALQQEGLRAALRGQITKTLKMLELSLIVFGAGSDEGKGIIQAIRALSPIAAQAAEQAQAAQEAAQQQQPGAPAPGPGGMPGAVMPAGGMPMTAPQAMRLGGGF